MISYCDGGCEATFNCGGDNGPLLRDAGWKPVWVRVFIWICPACTERLKHR